MSKHLDNTKQWAADAMYMPGVWITDVRTGDEDVTYTWYDEDEDHIESRIMTYPELQAAIEHLAAGTYTDHTGTEQPLNAYNVAACVNILNNYDEADYDANTDDIIAQQAVLGKQIYG